MMLYELYSVQCAVSADGKKTALYIVHMQHMHQWFLCLLCLMSHPCFLLSAELIYKEVSEWEDWKKNGVIRGQPAPLGE